MLTFVFRRLLCVTNSKAFPSGGSTSCCWRFVQNAVNLPNEIMKIKAFYTLSYIYCGNTKGLLDKVKKVEIVL
jgi:hypothetical protein